MKPYILNLAIILCMLLLSVSNLIAQNKSKMYGNTPDRLFPYNNFEKAYKYHFIDPIQFSGAGREKLPPKDLKEVRIGFLGPLEGSAIVSLGKQMLQGTMLAIEEANKKGGYKGLPYKLMVHNDAGLWGAAANEVVKMDDEKVWAFLGSIDDIVSHVALRAALKLEIPMVCTGNPDPTYTETNIPWTLRVISDDRQSGYAIGAYIFEKMKHKRVAVMRNSGRYGRVGVGEFYGIAKRMGHPIRIEERFDTGETDFKMQLESIKQLTPEAILIWGNAKESALIIKQIRSMGLKQPIYCSDRIVSKEFLEIAGPFAEGIVSTSPYNPEANNPKLKEFQINYFKRFKQQPDAFSAHAYDGMKILIEAINKGGLNRVLIRDYLLDLKTFQNYQGITGKIVFDATWNDIGDIWLAKVKNGKFTFILNDANENVGTKIKGAKN
ncbi:ABC transporter substrate-binding protein [Lutibacter sp.]|uniref:ABC transporter substrate-binding protein n=1 Tax=Lutibacter sp. TaxID=1925666 RepID=UPI00273261D2|nr:ABC transporter substrate-binding protein [Lutibacter sp.]MDP3314034.1 ABC transporter substrate-binding protein [Lutibacter sp.]